MRKQITISVPEEVLIGLLEASKESMRPLATEAVYRIKVGLGSLLLEKGFRSEVTYDDSVPISSYVLHRLTLWERVKKFFKR